MSRYDLTDFEWCAIEPLLLNKRRGVPRVNDRRVLNGIFWVLRSGAPWRDLPERYGPRTTCYNRFNRWWQAGVWDRLLARYADSLQEPCCGRVLKSERMGYPTNGYSHVCSSTANCRALQRGC